MDLHIRKTGEKKRSTKKWKTGLDKQRKKKKKKNSCGPRERGRKQPLQFLMASQFSALISTGEVMLHSCVIPKGPSCI